MFGDVLYFCVCIRVGCIVFYFLGFVWFEWEIIGMIGNGIFVIDVLYYGLVGIV